MAGSRKNAFTLIELLVIIAVTALLIAVLIPSLQAAKEQARRVHCATNLRTIGLGIVSFAGNNDDFLPTPQYTAGTSPMRAYVCYEAARPETPLQLAQLFEEGYIGDSPRILYCPSAAAEYRNYTADGPWGTVYVNGYIHAAYLYAPLSKERDAIGLPLISPRPRLRDLAQNRSIVTDKIDTWNNVAHQPSENIRGINVLFVDGSVRFCSEESVMDFDLWHPFGAHSSLGPGASDIAVRAILSSIMP
ncbi:MAG TPA: type II secretion system protein [Sedimentisphaerales bacterium]|nr:type II secretion system protein [Sedimentisphaerales bacterium]